MQKILIIQRKILDGVTSTLSIYFNVNNTVRQQAYDHLKDLSLGEAIVLKGSWRNHTSEYRPESTDSR